MNVDIDINNIELKTERLLLRPFRQSDLDDFFEYASVDGVGQMAGWVPHKNKEESQKILDLFINEKKTFAVVNNGKVIGSIGIEKYNEKQYPEFDEKKARELGYVLSKEYWGSGLMPEAAKEVIRYLFDDVGLDLLFCSHFIENNQSKRVIEKLGFKYYKDTERETRLGMNKKCKEYILYRHEYERD